MPRYHRVSKGEKDHPPTSSRSRECIIRYLTISTGVAAFLLIIVITLLAMQAEDDGDYNNLRTSTTTLSSMTSITSNMANTREGDTTYDHESMNSNAEEEQEKVMALFDHDHDDELLQQEQEEKLALLQHVQHEDSTSSTSSSTQQEMNDGDDEVLLMLQESETEELNNEESVLSEALSGMGNTIRIGLGRLFGSSSKYDNMSDEQVESIAEEVEKRLNIEITEELRQQADAIMQTNVQVIEDTIDAALEEEDKENGDIVLDEQEREQEYLYEAMEMVRTEIDEAALQLNNQMPDLALKIEKEILEEKGFSN